MTAASRTVTGTRRLRVRVRGAVQGVGFRPHVHGVARRLGLSGFVLNDGEGVLAEIEGSAANDFVGALARDTPPLARIETIDVSEIAPAGDDGFAIRPSRRSAAATRLVPDVATCSGCLADLFDRASRFHRYPFVTCTQCGPRFTIAQALPFDRDATAMAPFDACADCTRDYGDPANRRFHAQAIACARCGPQLSHSPTEIAARLRAGEIVALKGLGGYHLLCDARNDSAIIRLRRRKRRDSKPLALMVANAASLDAVASPTADERALAGSPAAPIVAMRARPGLPDTIAPGLRKIGVMLAPTPLHHLLFAELCGESGFRPGRAVDTVLVATSGNAPGEPIAMTAAQARTALAEIADLVVDHDRDIVARADDSVMAVIDGAPAFIRRARGFVPDPVELAEDGPDTIAFGGHLKATVTVTRGREAFVSQHCGDLDTSATARFHREAAGHLAALLGIRPALAACDRHPDYRSTLRAEDSGLPLVRVQHHAAHVAAIAAEHRVSGPLLGAALDGTGLGDDGTLWGGELILLENATHRRIGHLRPLPLPGGDRAAREAWRMGLSVCADLDLLDGPLARRLAALPGRDAVIELLRHNVHATTSSLGRVFDAAAALLGVCDVQSYEGEAAMRLEALVDIPAVLPNGFALKNGMLDLSPLLHAMAINTAPPAEAAALFHGTLAEALAAWIGAAAADLGMTRVALGGGCMMNAVLAEALCRLLRSRGLEPLLARAVPTNDGGLSLGQALIARRVMAHGNLTGD